MIGIGINISEPDGGFPEDIKDRAGAVFIGSDNDMRNRLITALLKKLRCRLEGFAEKDFAADYRERSILIGREVEIISSGGSKTARVVGIDDECRLIVETDSGTKALFCGEVSVKL